MVPQVAVVFHEVVVDTGRRGAGGRAAGTPGAVVVQAALASLAGPVPRASLAEGPLQVTAAALGPLGVGPLIAAGAGADLHSAGG